MVKVLSDEFKNKLNLSNQVKLKVVREVKSDGPEWIVYLVSGINSRELTSDVLQENLLQKMRDLLDDEENFAEFLSDFSEEDALFYTEVFSNKGEELSFKRHFKAVADELSHFIDEGGPVSIKTTLNVVVDEFPPSPAMGDFFLAIGSLLHGNKVEARSLILSFLSGYANEFGLSDELLATKMFNKHFEVVKVLRVKGDGAK